MTKIAIKSETRTLLGGIFSIMSTFHAHPISAGNTGIFRRVLTRFMGYGDSADFRLY